MTMVLDPRPLSRVETRALYRRWRPSSGPQRGKGSELVHATSPKRWRKGMSWYRYAEIWRDGPPSLSVACTRGLNT